MSYETKIDCAIKLIDDHNSLITSIDNKPNLIDSKKFIYGIKISGGTSENTLKHFTHEDVCKILIESYMSTAHHNPIALARSICEQFRSNFNLNEEHVNKTDVKLSDKKAKNMSLLELFERYEYNNPTSAIYIRLKELAQNNACVVFDSNGKVLADYSSKLLAELLDGYPARETFVFKNDAWKVYKIGEKPPKMFDENPIFIGRALRADGTCDQLNRSWEGVSLEIRQLIRLMVLNKKTNVDLNYAHDLMDMALDVDAPKRLIGRDSHAFAKYKILKDLGTLPLLKVVSVNSSVTGKFPIGKPVQL